MSAMARLAAAALLAALAACQGTATPAQRLDRFLEQGAQAARERDTGAFMELVAEDYMDGQGRDREQLRQYLRGMFLRFGAIEVDHQVLELGELGDVGGEALVRLRFAGPRGRQDPLWALRADSYRVRLELVAEPGGPYRLLRASWSEQPE